MYACTEIANVIIKLDPPRLMDVQNIYACRQPIGIESTMDPVSSICEREGLLGVDNRHADVRTVVIGELSVL